MSDFDDLPGIRMELYDVFTFGKYKSNTLENVIVNNPWYVDWAIVQGIFEIDNATSKLLDESMEVHQQNEYDGCETDIY